MKNSSGEKTTLNMPGYRKIVFTIVTFILFIILMEGGLRLFYFVKDKIHGSRMSFSDYIGWENIPGISWKYLVSGYGEIEYSTKRFGFRLFGDVNSNKTKIFVIGDSLTQCSTVSDGKTYYDYIKKNNNNVEMFSYGCGGYGSLQEYMIIDKYYDVIKPHMILWQFTSNDIINNDHELESASFRHNNHMTRPYYKDGRIERLYPKQNRGWFYATVQASYILRLVDIRVNILKAEKYGSIEDELSEDHPLFKRAVNTTSEIMGLVRKRVGNIPIVAFCGINEKWLGDTFLKICKKYDIQYIQNIPESIEKAKEFGMIVDGSPNDAHWNDVGHSIVGKIILDYLIENNLLQMEGLSRDAGSHYSDQ